MLEGNMPTQSLSALLQQAHDHNQSSSSGSDSEEDDRTSSGRRASMVSGGSDEGGAPFSARRGSKLNFDLEGGLQAIDNWSDKMEAATGFHGASIMHGAKVAEKHAPSSPPRVGPSTSSRQSQPRSPACPETQSPEVVGYDEHMASHGSSYAPLQPAGWRPDMAPPAVNREEDSDEDLVLNADNNPSSRSSSSTRKDEQKKKKKKKAASPRADAATEEGADSNVLGEANFASDQELLDLLKKKPKYVPELRTKESFRRYFGGMTEKRLSNLLSQAYMHLDGEDGQQKVQKRLTLMKGFMT